MKSGEESWEVWAYGKAVADMTDSDIRTYAQRAWNEPDVAKLTRFRNEAKRRGIVVA